jgi:hypothetical protein
MGTVRTYNSQVALLSRCGTHRRVGPRRCGLFLLGVAPHVVNGRLEVCGVLGTCEVGFVKFLRGCKFLTNQINRLLCNPLIITNLFQRPASQPPIEYPLIPGFLGVLVDARQPVVDKRWQAGYVSESD